MKEKWHDFQTFGKMNKEVVLYPELLASVLKNKEEDIFTIWLIAKKIDIQNNGLIHLSELLNIVKLTLGLSSTFIYNKINKGIDLYWRKPSGKNGKKLVGLISINKIIERLKPQITRVMPVSLNLNYLKSNSKNIRNLYISIVAGRYTDLRPISIETICNNTGLSESTVHKALKSCNHLKTKSNYKILCETDNLNNIKIYMLKNQDKSIIVEQSDNLFRLLKQVGNTYILMDFDRLPLSTRPKSLKKNDKFMLDILEEKRYYINRLDIVSDNCKIVSF